MNIPNKIFIVPYRDRIEHKLHFEIYMKYILEDISKDSYEIYFSHQMDNRPFNRGAVKNIGFIAMRDKYPDNYRDITFIFNDIDCCPYKKNLLNYDTTHGTVKHFFGYTFALGGLFSITGADFEKIGGFPNFWGWGFEDNTIYDLVKKNGIFVDRSTFFYAGDSKIIQIPHGRERTLAKQEQWNYRFKDYDSLNYIRNLKYTIKNEFIEILEFETKYSHDNITYYNSDKISRVVPDKRFLPKNSKYYNLQKMMFR